MSIKRWKLGWKRCNCVKCEASMTIEQTEENCGWVMLEDHKEEVARLKAEVERLQSIHSIDSIGIEQLKAEVERLTSDIQMEKENEDRLVRLHQEARNEVERLKQQVEYWRIESDCNHGRWLRCLQDLERIRKGGQP